MTFHIHRLMVCIAVAAAVSCVYAISVSARPLKITASLGVYGNIAQQIGGKEVTVFSVLTTPAQDPHLFDPSPQIGQKFAEADIIIVNGGGYDGWAEKLATALSHKSIVINVTQYLDPPSKITNPHYWYSIPSIKNMAQHLAEILIEADSSLAHKEKIKNNLAGFMHALSQIEAKIHALKGQYPNIKYAATEPVFDLMAEQLGFESVDKSLEHAVMNETEPSPADIASFEKNVDQRSVKIFFYNSQVSSQLAEHMRNAAVNKNIPIVNITETLPPHMNYQQWINSELDRVLQALQEHQK